MGKLAIPGLGTFDVPDDKWPTDPEEQKALTNRLIDAASPDFRKPTAIERVGAAVGEFPRSIATTLRDLAPDPDKGIVSPAGQLTGGLLRGSADALDVVGQGLQGLSSAIGHADLRQPDNRAPHDDAAGNPVNQDQALHVTDALSNPVGYSAQTAGGVIPYLTGGAEISFANQFAATVGPTVDAIAKRNARPDPKTGKVTVGSPTPADWAEALADSTVEASVMALASKFGVDKSTVKAVAKSVAAGWGAGAVNSGVNQVAATGTIDPQTVLRDASDNAAGFGVVTGGARFAHGVGAVATGVARARNDANAGREYSDNPNQVSSDLRVADALDARRKQTDTFDAGHDVPNDKQFKTIALNIKTRLRDLSDALETNGHITGDQADELNTIITDAAKHNRSLGEGDGGGYFDGEIDRVRNMGLKPQAEKAITNALRDMNTAVYNGLQKNTQGPFERGAKRALPALDVAAGLLGSIPGGGPVSPFGAGTGALSAAVTHGIVKAGARGLDSALSLRDAPIVRRAAARRRALAGQNIDYGNTAKDLQDAIDSAQGSPNAVVQTPPTTPSGRLLRDMGVQRNGGWLAMMRQKGNEILPPDKALTESDIFDAINELHSKGAITDKQRQDLYDNRNGEIPRKTRLYYDIQDLAIHNKNGGNPVDLGPRPSPDQSQPAQSSPIRNKASYAQTMRNVADATQAAHDAAPNDAMRAVTADVANARTRPEKMAKFARAMQDHPQHADYLDQHVRPLVGYGPHGISSDREGGLQPLAMRHYLSAPDLSPEEKQHFSTAISAVDKVIRTFMPNAPEGIGTPKKTIAMRGPQGWYSSAGVYGTPHETGQILYYALKHHDGAERATSDITKTVTHEALHYLKRNGFFTPSEWFTLEKAARSEDWFSPHNIDGRYVNDHEAQRTEEAIAEHLSKGKDSLYKGYSPGVRKVLLKVHDFFQSVYTSVKSALGDQMNAKDILNLVERGVVGARKPRTPQPTSGEVVARVDDKPKPDPDIHPLQSSDENAKSFHEAISNAKATSDFGAAVHVYSPEEYAGMKLYMTANGQAGFAIKPGEVPDIVSVFNTKGNPDGKVSDALIQRAIDEGGRKLDAFDTVLPALYSRNGFRVVSRMKWNDEYQPEGWDKQRFSQFNDGKPDVVFMAYAPGAEGQYKPGEGKYVKDYDRAVALQEAAAKKASPLSDAVQNYRNVFVNVKNAFLNAVPAIKDILPYLDPAEVSNTNAQGLAAIVKMFESTPSAEEIASVAHSGRAKKGWYASSAKTILDVFGYEDAPRFSALLAAMSPQCSVESNATNALHMWVNWNEEGRPTDRASIIRIMGRSVQGKKAEKSILDAWTNNTVTSLSADDPHTIRISGNKVNSFMANLNDMVHAVTNDAWMANYADVDQDTFKGPSYHGYSAKVRQAAEIATKLTGEKWTPREIQETVWSWAKTLYEKGKKSGENRSMQQILETGGMTHQDVKSTPDFATLFTDGVFRNILERGGYGRQLNEVSAGRSSSAPNGPPGQQSVYSAEGSQIDPGAFRQHLNTAAGRLDALLQRRRASGETEDASPDDLIARVRRRRSASK